MSEKISHPAKFKWKFELKVTTNCPACGKLVTLVAKYLTHTHIDDGHCRACGATFSWKIGATQTEHYVVEFYKFIDMINKMFQRWSSARSVYFSKIRKGAPNS